MKDMGLNHSYNWIKNFEERELSEIRFARAYARHFDHGTSGHLAMTIIAKLSEKLCEIEREAESNRSTKDETAS